MDGRSKLPPRSAQGMLRKTEVHLPLAMLFLQLHSFSSLLLASIGFFHWLQGPAIDWDLFRLHLEYLCLNDGTSQWYYTQIEQDTLIFLGIHEDITRGATQLT